MKKVFTLLVAILCLSSLVAQTVKIGATDYATINEALTAAVENDVIDITGTHTESLTIEKSVTLRGTDPTTDIIQASETGTPASNRVIFIDGLNGAVNVTIENLSIKNGYSAGATSGGGIMVDKVSGLVNLNNLIIEDNTTSKSGAGISIAGANVNMDYCTIRNNVVEVGATGGFGGGIHAVANNGGVDATVNIKNSLIHNNSAQNSGGGLYLDGNNNYGNDHYITINVENTTIAFNTAPTKAAGAFIKGANHTTDGVKNITVNFNNITMAYNDVSGTPTTDGIGLIFYANPIFNMSNSIVSLNGDQIGTVNDINFGASSTVNLINNIFGKAYGIATNVANNVNNLTGKYAIIKLATELTDKGGKTLVLPTLGASIAIDAADVTTASEYDARENMRDETPDIGAYEFKKATAITLTATKSTILPNEELPIKVEYTPADADAQYITWEVTGGQFVNGKFSSDVIDQYTITASSSLPVSLSDDIVINVSQTTGISDESIENNKRISYPTVTSDILYFNKQIKNIKVININGSIVKKVQHNTQALNVSDLEQGMYILIFDDGKNEKFIKK